MERTDVRKGIGPVQRFGRYTLVKRIATGGMAEIWLARQGGLAGFNRFVVVKRILSHLSDQSTFVDMFLDEARTSALLNHPNIVQIYDLGREGSSYFIAMEYIAGENLSALAWRARQRDQPLTLQLAARIIADASKALHYAHHLRGSDGRSLRIVHRDVSPQNILVTYDGEVKLVDFGIAKAATQNEQTKTGMLKGKFSYMSPEQCLGAPVDMRSDIFALGILLYELCTGHRLFKHESELMILDMITRQDVVPPSKVAPQLPAELERIILRALEKEASNRYPHARALQLDLEAFLQAHPGPSTPTELAAYIRSLFDDRVEEKRRLIELASRDDFEAVFGAGPEAATMRSSPGPAAPVGVFTAPTDVPGGRRHAPPAEDATAPAKTRTIPPPRVWLANLLLAVAVFVIAVSGGVLWVYLGPGGGALQVAPGGGARGRVLVDSLPPGATVYLDGEPMRLASGAFAKTPVEVGPLSSERPYTLELRKDGYVPFRDTLRMSDELDGARLQPRLPPRPGSLHIRAEGEVERAARLLMDGRPVGRGSRTLDLPGERAVKVEARHDDYACRVTPETVTIPPGGMAEVAVTCAPLPPPAMAAAPDRRRPPPAAARSGESRPAARAEASPARRSEAGSSAASGCAPRPDLPPGFVTIDTRPHSDIFWNDRKLGETPLAHYELPAGCVELEARGETANKRFKVRVEPNQVAIYRLELSP